MLERMRIEAEKKRREERFLIKRRQPRRVRFIVKDERAGV
jgi:hypothetical protein